MGSWRAATSAGRRAADRVTTGVPTCSSGSGRRESNAGRPATGRTREWSSSAIAREAAETRRGAETHHISWSGPAASPVRGLRATPVLRGAVWNTPNYRSTTRSPRDSAETTDSNSACTASRAARGSRVVASIARLTRSAFTIPTASYATPGSAGSARVCENDPEGRVATGVPK